MIPEPTNDDREYSLEDAYGLLIGRVELSLIRRCYAAERERDDLRIREREVTCVWCGYQFKSTLQSQAQHLYEHAKVCEKHPVHAAESQLAAARAEVERLWADLARPVSKEGRAMNRRKGRMVRASELKKEIDGIMEKFGDTCFYVTGLAWGSVALWQQADVDELEAALLAKDPDHA